MRYALLAKVVSSRTIVGEQREQFGEDLKQCFAHLNAKHASSLSAPLTPTKGVDGFSVMVGTRANAIRARGASRSLSPKVLKGLESG
ncbi:MAG: hypothetical protein Q7Q71_06170 [Verrucomicrobiota bacterium JB023]|nr:hypothetical protein [Verrucomicrobiota bacterium JB023]